MYVVFNGTTLWWRVSLCKISIGSYNCASKLQRDFIEKSVIIVVAGKITNQTT